MAIQMRRGLKEDFDPTKMLAGEWAVAIDADTKNQIVWMCFAPGVVKRMGTYEDFMAKLDDFKAELEEEFRGLFDQMAEEIRSDLALVDRRLHEIDEELEIRLKQPFISNEGAKTLTDSDDGYMRELKIDGATEQKQYSGYNLTNFADVVRNSGGLTTTIKDGFVTFKGTSNRSVVDNFAHIMGYELTAGTYSIDLNIGGSKRNDQMYLYIRDTYSTICDLYTAKNPSGRNTFTLSSNTQVDIGMFTVNGTEYDFSIKPMLNVGSEFKPYEPYVGGQPSPSPSYPQKIESVGGHMGCVDLGTLTWVAVGTQFYQSASLASLIQKPKSDDVVANIYAEKYTVKSRMTSTDKNDICVDESGNILVRNRDELPSGLLAYELAEGATPEKYAIVMENYGNNLIAEIREGYAWNASIADYQANPNRTAILVKNLQPNTSYTISGFVATSAYRVVNGSAVGNVTGTTFTVSSACDVIFNADRTQGTANAKVEIGTEANPYIKQMHILTPPYPLNKIGDAVDYADAERGVWKYGFKTVVLNGSSSENWMRRATVNSHYRFRIDIGDTKESANIKCNLLLSGTTTNTFQEKNCIAETADFIEVYIDETKDFTNAQFKEWLTTHNLVIVYELATPIEIPMSAEDAEFLRNLKTYYPSTNIVVTDGKFDVDTTFLYKLRLESYVKKVTGQITDTRKTIDNINARQLDVEAMTALAYINSEYATALAELN